MKEMLFFDRNYYIELLSKHLCNLTEGYRQNLAFIGPESVGKTSIILHFLNKYIDSRIVPIYVLVKEEELKFFIERFIGSLLYNLLSINGIEIKEDIDYLINKSEKFIPQTVKKIREIKTIRKKESVFLELLSICDLLYKEIKKFCVVIFDEFHNLETLGLKNLYKEWAKALVLQKNTMFILVSSSSFKAKKILGNNLNLLFGKFELVEVEPFDYKTSKEFLTDKLNGLKLEDRLINFLVSLCAGMPFYLNLFADNIVKVKDRIFSESYINKNIIFDILTALMFEENGILYQRFCNYLNRISKSYLNQLTIKVLCAIASGYNRTKEITKLIHIQKKDVYRITHYLLQMDIVTKNGDFFIINDRLLNLWLKAVYQKKNSTLDLNLHNQHQMFKKELEKIFNEFISESNKTLLEKMIDIMHLFENAYVNIDNKKIKLTSFREIKPLCFDTSSIKEGLIARSAEQLWIIGINKNSPLRENDIDEFSQLCNRYRQKNQKKIIITPYTIDTNVRLKALEEKILTWEIKNINILCELFNRNIIVY